MASWWSTKSNSSSKLVPRQGMSPLPSPLAVSSNATSHQWLRNGHSASFTLPATCVHRCSVSRVSAQGSKASSGHTVLVVACSSGTERTLRLDASFVNQLPPVSG